MKRMAAILMALLVLVSFTGCEPESTVTAERTKVDCLNRALDVTGYVTPADATKKVVLQRTVGGKWVDWLWYDNYSSAATKQPITSGVAPSGWYNLAVVGDNDWTGEHLKGTIHLRVRTEGNGGISPSWYTTWLDPDCA